MKIESKDQNNVLVLVLAEKRLDAKLAIDFKQTIDKFIQEGHYAIAFDMSHIEFIDSSGLGALVACLKLAGNRGKFVLFSVKPAVAAMFKLTRMDRVFNLYDTEEQAVQMLKGTE
jgi:anti-sigma B factor antagonist